MNSWTSRVLALVCLLAPGASVLAQGTLDAIAERGSFRIGYRTDARPLSFEENGQPAGYSVDICRRIAAAVSQHLSLPDMRVEFVPVTLAGRFDAVVDGDIDIECGATTITLGRLERVDFTLMTFVTGGSVVSRADEPVAMMSELDGKRVAVIEDTSTDEALRSYLDENDIDARVVRVASSAEGMSRLLEERVDAFASDQIVLLGDVLTAMETDDEFDVAFAQELFSYEPYAFMVRRNDADFRLVADRAIAEVFRSGQFARLYQNWIGSAGISPSPLLLGMYEVQALRE